MAGRPKSAAYADRASTQSLGLLADAAILQRLRRKANSNFDFRAAEIQMINDLLPYQRDFATDFSHKYVGFCGGYGCVAGETLINGTPIKELTTQPIQVQTLGGPAWATPAYKKGVAPLYRVRTSSGQEVLVTKAHRFLTPFGWQELSHLRPGSLIAVRDRPCGIPPKETARDSSVFGPWDSRSCGELPSPSQVFFQEQFQQFCEPSIFHDLCQCYQHSSCHGSPHFSHQVGHREASVQRVETGTLSSFLREHRIDEQPLESQPHQSCSREVRHPSSHVASQFQSRACLAPQYQQQSFRPLSFSRSLHKPLTGSEGCIHGHSLPCTYSFAHLSEEPTVRDGRLRFGLPSGLALQSHSSCPSDCIFPEGLCPSCIDPQLSTSHDPRVEPAWSREHRSSQYSWSSVEDIDYVRTDDFYDLHVPLWNHYEAHGILHHNSGKTYTLAVKQLLLCFRSQGFTHLFLEPTIPLIDDVALPTWNSLLEKYGIPHTFKVSPRPVFKLLLPGGETPILLRSMENYERLIGVNAASIASDETDTTRQEIAEKAMIRLQGRVRVGNCPQIAAASTPEGYGFMYTFFEEQKADNKKLYRGKSEDNPYLDKSFVEDLKTKYHPQLVKAYLNGEFVNLESATVFYEFNREKHSTGVFLPEPNERIVFGADFNVGQCHALYGVVRSGPKGQQLHCFAESKVSDTFALVAHLQRNYPRHLANRLITCYPDASGANDSTSSTQSDHEILTAAGVQVVAQRRNPPIAETLAHTNVHLHRDLILVNQTSCHETVNALERWSYDSKTLKPAKGGATDYSHPGDAFRYLVWQVFPRAGSRAGHGGRWR